MGFQRIKAVLAATVAASILGTTAAVASPSKLDARIRARRAEASSGGYAPAGAGGGPVAAGPRHSVLIRVSPGTPLAALRAAFPNADFGSMAGDVVTARADDTVLDALSLDGRVQGIDSGVRTHPVMDVVRSSSTSGGLALGTIYGTALTDLAGTTGAGVIVGIVDTGIDFKHRDFLIDNTYPGTSTSRILSIWDQTISSHIGGPFPVGLSYTYGAEYTQAQLTAKVRTGAGTINTEDADGHGTHVASIAAGDGTDTNGTIPSGTFMGMAPNAEIIFVRTTFDTADVLDGVNYIVARAAAAGKPVVINLSLGTQRGPHDGTSSFEAALGAVAANTPVTVAMGNDGAASPHAGIDLGPGGSAGVIVNVDQANVGRDAVIEFWVPRADHYNVTVALGGVTGSVTGGFGTVPTGVLGGHTVTLINSSDTVHPTSELIYIKVSRSPYITVPSISVTLTRVVNGGSGRIDGWVEPSGDYISFGSYVDNTRTLGEPACALNVFGVGSYASKKYWDGIDGFTYNFSNQSILGNLSAFSSQGPTRDGRQQPEVVAPGDVISGALSAATTAYPGAPYVLIDGRHRVLRGTSMAAPVVAGILADRLQWGLTRTVPQLRSILRAQARTDPATGAVPSYAWGYGKVSSSPQPTSAPTGLTATTLGPSSVTWNWGTVVAADSYSLYYATNPTKLIASGLQPPYIQTGLAANTTTGVLIRGNGAGVNGPGAFISTSTLALPPAALPTLVPHVDSATVSWAVCPAAPPAALSCWGYSVTASTAPNGSGAQFAAVTLSRSVNSLIITGLQPLTQYYFRQATLNYYGATTSTGAVSATTLTDLVPPINPLFSAATASSLRFDWNQGANINGLTYVADASTSPVFAGTVLSSSTKNPYAIFTGMLTNASYYFRVQAVGGPYLAPAGAVPTLAAAPVLSSAPFSAVSQTGFTVAWSSGVNYVNTLYQAEISISPAFTPLADSSSTRNAFATFTGLAANTLYYVRAAAISQGGIPTTYTAFGSTPTFVLDPTLPPEPFSNQASDGFTFSFNSGGNPAGTMYTVRVSTDPLFYPLTASVNTTGVSSTFSGLNSNRRYYADVAALNISGTPTAYTVAATTATIVVAPGAPVTAVSARTVSALSSSWTTSTLGPGTNFTLEASAFANFSVIAGAFTTANAFATVSPLSANTVYYLRARALSVSLTPDGPWTTLGSGSTLANAPGAVASPFPLVGVASMTVAWSALPLAPQVSACEGYLAELSASPAFTTILRSSSVAAGAATANFSGLSYGTTYYTRVASLDWEGNPNYLVIGATRTNSPLLSSGTVTGSGLTLILTSAFAAAPGVTAQIDPGTFPPGTIVTMLSGVTLDLANPRSSVAKLTALGTAVGIDISAGGLQPQKPVRLTLSYDPLFLPPGGDARRLIIARYDDAAALWTLVPSAVDVSGHLIVATLDHFSSYSPFFATAGASVSDGVVFPQPWEAGEPGGAYGAQTLTFANYPAGTKVRLMSLTGEQVWDGVAGANGILTWDGRNKSGRNVGSGTYYAIIEGAGARKVRRVVVIR